MSNAKILREKKTTNKYVVYFECLLIIIVKIIIIKKTPLSLTIKKQQENTQGIFNDMPLLIKGKSSTVDIISVLTNKTFCLLLVSNR